MPVGGGEEDAGGAFGFAAALFPVAQRIYGDIQQTGVVILCPNRPNIPKWPRRSIWTPPPVVCGQLTG